MTIEYDPSKRQRTLDERQLDFEDAVDVLSDFHVTDVDRRFDYGETRYITLGALRGRPIVLVWTQRGDNVRVISMRIADEDERQIYREQLDRSG